MTVKHFDTIIIGAGIAGLSCALSCDVGQKILLISEHLPKKSGSTPYAQGGIAFSEACEASVQSHMSDTITAGAGLCDSAVVESVVRASKGAIDWLQAQGICFDTNPDNPPDNPDGTLSKGIEGGHNQPRIIHIGGDATGAGITKGLFQQVCIRDNITFQIGTLNALHTDAHNAVCGVTVNDILYQAQCIVLATGGASGLFKHRTATAQSCTAFQLALGCGAVASDLEFFQYHPTALDVSQAKTPQKTERLPLISEAVRGHGGILKVQDSPLDTHHPKGSLAPRDVVSRAVFAARQNGHTVFLDTTAIENFAKLFPTVYACCQLYGIDTNFIPVRTAVHYQMGGIATDISGHTGISGLFVIGEAAATGVHGANRLASNSLLEACVMGINCANAVSKTPAPSSIKHCIQGGIDSHISTVWRLNAQALGMIRTADSLLNGIKQLQQLPKSPNVVTATMCMLFALKRQESIGAHYRRDYPHTIFMPRQYMDLKTYKTEIRNM